MNYKEQKRQTLQKQFANVETAEDLQQENNSWGHRGLLTWLGVTRQQRGVVWGQVRRGGAKGGGAN